MAGNSFRAVVSNCDCCGKDSNMLIYRLDSVISFMGKRRLRYERLCSVCEGWWQSVFSIFIRNTFNSNIMGW